jgi:hypothetical protein
MHHFTYQCISAILRTNAAAMRLELALVVTMTCRTASISMVLLTNEYDYL